MKKNLILAAVFSLLATIGISAQDTTKPADAAKPADASKPADAAKPTDFSGKWTLDVGKSKLDERMRIESMTLNVTQTEKELKTESTIKRTPPPANANMTPGGGRGGIGGGLAGTGPETRTYSLDGKETTEDNTAGGIPSSAQLKAELKKDGTLNLSVTRKFNTPMGAAEAVTKEAWSLSADGKTLTISRDQTTPRGSFSATLVLNKN
jgi:hypothetical protein